jgi:DNA-binding SARP family transcriptional activator
MSLQTDNKQEPSPARLRLLGGFDLRIGAERPILPPAAQRLLAFLALRGPAARTTVAGTLWGDQPEHRARASLRTILWRLHRAGITIEIGGGSMLALPAGTHVDVDDLVALPEVAVTELLPGWYDDWVLMDRERIRQRLLHLLEQRVEQALAGDSGQDALDLALLVVRAGPLRESAHRLVIRAHLAEGNPAEARAHYLQVAALMRCELGVAPSPQMRSLIASVSDLSLASPRP